MMLGLREDVAPEKDIGLGDARVVKCRLTKTEGYFIPLTLWFIFILSGRPRICGKPPCLCCWGMTPAIPGWTFYAQICSKTIWHNREWGTMGTGLVMLHPAMTELKTKWFSHQKMASMGMFAKFGTGRGDWLWPGSHKASSQQSFAAIILSWCEGRSPNDAIPWAQVLVWSWKVWGSQVPRLAKGWLFAYRQKCWQPEKVNR